MRLIRRAGTLYPGFGEVPWKATLAWAAVSERHFRRLLGELRPTFQWKKVGDNLFYWSPFLANDLGPNRAWTNLARLNGLLELEEREVPFVAEVRAHYALERSRQREDRRGLRRGRGGKNIGNLNGHPASEVRTSETAKKKPFPYYCRDLSSKRIPEEEIPRPEGGSRLERWDLEWKIDENSGGSALSGGGPAEPERPRVLEGVEKERAEARGRPPLAKAPSRRLAATETRPERGAGAEGRPGLLTRVERDSGPPREEPFAVLLQRAREIARAEFRRIEAEGWEGVERPRGGPE
jgi:hypothetical protein